ncbi:MAG TPA: sigma-70 family RNA polymerase sigma factor [Solirubrobacteraceae bacterium]|nr:sigma-70 family RNA polymerase sigma factor [Solirubrobacteraceae bacterium]
MSISHPRSQADGDPPQAAARHQPRLLDDRDLATLVCAARAGDDGAWSSLVRRFDRRLRAIARSYRLAPSDVDDVVQATWLSLLEDIRRVREPAAIAGWLETVARRNAMRQCYSRNRETLSDDPRLGDQPHSSDPAANVLAAERRAALAGAMAALPGRHSQLMMVLLDRPALGYRQVSELLSMPVGSIGPIRARSLVRLSHDPQLRDLLSDEISTAC